MLLMQYVKESNLLPVYKRCACIRVMRFLLIATIGFGLFSASSLYAQVEQNTVELYLASAEKKGLKPNRLISESSPYLLQHAYNPVQWYAWGEAAFEKARKQNKPVFLSIGYSTCHWCHVMAHESFENKKVAAILNKHFISIKLDREERPDIDSVYMAATQLISGSGGWPMTVFLNHKLEPFHAGTYYPRESTDEYRGFIDLVLKINTLWEDDRSRLDTLAAVISEKLQTEKNSHVIEEKIRADIQLLAFKQITQSFDIEYGGFGDAPKFPRPGLFAYLSAVMQLDTPALADKKIEARLMLEKTLNEMADGGIYDQIGGGFHRYSVDAQWQVPHFEKMLYSQALLSKIYISLYVETGKPGYKKIFSETLEFIFEEMMNVEGGFYSALDADSVKPEDPSEKSEGAYYLWSESEIKKVLTKEEWQLFSRYYDIQPQGNIYSDPQGEFGANNILYVSEDYKQRELTVEQRAVLINATNKLNAIRIKRPRPHLDDKVITAWNGMMISTLSSAYTTTGESSYLKAAINAAIYIETHLLDSKSYTLKRSIRNGRVSVDSGLSDYAWYIRGLLDLYRVTKERHWLTLSVRLQEKQNGLFYDQDSAAYFDASGDDSSLLFRSKSVYDGALPSVNAIAIENLFELSGLVDNKQWHVKALAALDFFASVINTNPAACASLLAVKMRYVDQLKSTH